MHGKSVTQMTRNALGALYDYPWPGNVRELRNVVESMVVLARDPILDVDDIPEHVQGGGSRPLSTGQVPGLNLDEIERRKIKEALATAGGNRNEAAKLLGLSERTLYRKIKQMGISEGA